MSTSVKLSRVSEARLVSATKAKTEEDSGKGSFFSILFRVRVGDRQGMNRVRAAIRRSGAIVAVSAKKFGRRIEHEIAADFGSQDAAASLVQQLRKMPKVEVVSVKDRTLLVHQGGKIEVASKLEIKGRSDLSLAYTPGVAQVCTEIARDPNKAFQYTIKHNTVAVVTDGTAVLGLGDLGPKASLPVMEGKALLFKQLAGIDAFPIALDTKDPVLLTEIVRSIAPVFGGINLEDISAPRCFEIEESIRSKIDIPVFHDDQHGTAVVVLAALLNAVKVVGKSIEDLKVVVAGAGAAGVACSRILMSRGVRNIVACDRGGVIYRGRESGMTSVKEWFARITNPNNEKGTIHDVMNGADLFLGLSGPGIIDAEDIRKMARDPMVFAIANPVPEIMPEEAQRYAKVVATGRSDYPNQINNALVFPGVFRGALDCHAREINEPMKVAAAEALASVIPAKELRADHIIPSIFDEGVVPRVAKAVREAAIKTGVARTSENSGVPELIF